MAQIYLWKICAICGIIKIHVIRHFHDVAKKTNHLSVIISRCKIVAL